MSETPRTTEAIFLLGSQHAENITPEGRTGPAVVLAKFAEILERELATTKAALSAAEQRFKEMEEAWLKAIDLNDRQAVRVYEAEQRAEAMVEDLANANEGYASQFKEIHELRDLIRLIFASTHPYSGDSGTFTDEVTKEFHRLFPHEFDTAIASGAGESK